MQNIYFYKNENTEFYEAHPHKMTESGYDLISELEIERPNEDFMSELLRRCQELFEICGPVPDSKGWDRGNVQSMVKTTIIFNMNRPDMWGGQ